MSSPSLPSLVTNSSRLAPEISSDQSVSVDLWCSVSLAGRVSGIDKRLSVDYLQMQYPTMPMMSQQQVPCQGWFDIDVELPSKLEKLQPFQLWSLEHDVKRDCELK